LSLPPIKGRTPFGKSLLAGGGPAGAWQRSVDGDRHGIAPPNLLPASPLRQACPMNQRPRMHSITETRDWAKILLAAGAAIALVILAAKGELSAAAIAAAGSFLR
jgi:hypothetical protein